MNRLICVVFSLYLWIVGAEFRTENSQNDPARSITSAFSNLTFAPWKLDAERYNDRMACMRVFWRRLRARVRNLCRARQLQREIVWTASIYDIGRATWLGFERPYEVYLERLRTNIFAILNNSRVGAVLFVDEAATAHIYRYIDQLPFPSSLCLIAIESKDIPYSSCLGKEMNSSIPVMREHLLTSLGPNRSQVHLLNPEFNYPAYNIQTNFKMMILHHVALVNPFNSTHCVHIDAGYHHFPLAGDLNPKRCGTNQDLLCLGINKVRRFHADVKKYRADPYFTATAANYVQNGAAQSGSILAAANYGRVMDHIILSLLLGFSFSNDDQVMWITAAAYFPQLFQALECHGWEPCGKLVIYDRVDMQSQLNASQAGANQNQNQNQSHWR